MVPEKVVSPVREEEDDNGGQNDNAPIEPMSALLRRRAEDWSIKPKTPKVIDQSGNSSPKEIGPLHVKAEKLQTLGEDCPCSPKRVNSRRKGADKYNTFAG